MRSSVWSALGNTYVVVEPDPGSALDAASGTRSRRRYRRHRGGGLAGVEDMSILIWNPDGSQAELSGNGTRIAAAWLAERTGARRSRFASVSAKSCARCPRGRRDRAGPRRRARRPARGVAGIAFVPVSVGNPHAVVARRPRLRSGASDPARNSRAISRAHERPSRPRRRPGRGHCARLGARGGGDGVIRDERSRRRGGNSPAGEVLVHFPGGDLRVYLENGRARAYRAGDRVR